MTPSFSHADWFRSRLVVLSDRRPAPGDARTELEVAIEAALREHDGVWLGRHATAQLDLEQELEEADAGAGALGRWSVLDEAAARPDAAMDGWAAYVRANAAYAEQILESISPDGAVWINGSRWLLVAPALRQLGHRGPIGLVLDVPFPAPGRLEALPWHGDVIAALCELDLVGFRTPACAERFEACCARTGRRDRPRIGGSPGESASASHGALPGWVPSFLQLLAGPGRGARRGELTA